RFAVRSDDAGARIVVTRNKVNISGLEQPLLAGQQLASTSRKPSPAPNAVHLLEWTRDLVAAAEPPLVPASRYAGGALVADPQGQEARLSLRRYHIDVFIEDGCARTTIDQTYFNNESTRLEGTFRCPRLHSCRVWPCTWMASAGMAAWSNATMPARFTR